MQFIRARHEANWVEPVTVCVLPVAYLCVCGASYASARNPQTPTKLFQMDKTQQPCLKLLLSLDTTTLSYSLYTINCSVIFSAASSLVLPQRRFTQGPFNGPGALPTRSALTMFGDDPEIFLVSVLQHKHQFKLKSCMSKVAASSSLTTRSVQNPKHSSQ